MVEQARGLGYVHLERVGTRAFTSGFDTGAADSSSSFVRTLDTPARVDCGRRVGPGVRTLRALFSLPLSFFFFCTTMLCLLAPQCAVCGLFFSRHYSTSLFSSFRFSSTVIPFVVESPALQVSSHLPASRTLGGVMKVLCCVLCCCTIDPGEGQLYCCRSNGRVGGGFAYYWAPKRHR